MLDPEYVKDPKGFNERYRDRARAEGKTLDLAITIITQHLALHLKMMGDGPIADAYKAAIRAVEKERSLAGDNAARANMALGG